MPYRIKAPTGLSAVSTTPVAITIPVPEMPVTLKNTGGTTTSNLFYIFDDENYPLASTGFAGTAAQLKAAGGNELLGGQNVVIAPAPPFLHIVAPTGGSTNAQMLSGELVG